METSSGPRYAQALLDRRDDEELSLHLGFWPGDADRDLAAAQRRLDALVLDAADLADGQVVLDVGCGIGGTLREVSRRHPASRLLGVNPDEAQLDVARRAVPEATFHAARAGGMPIPTGTVDRVLSVEAAFHFESRADFLAEARRVLRPGGRIALTDLVPTGKMRELARTGAPAFAIERVIQRGIGPWTDLWGDTPDWTELADPVVYRDISAQSQPSYRVLLGPDVHVEPGRPFHDDESGMNAAVALLEWLQATGHVRMVLVVIDR